MKEVFERYISYLDAERNFSSYTIRNYRNDLIGNIRSGKPKGFFQYLQNNNISSLKKVNRVILREYISYLMENDICKRSIARKLSAIRSFFRYLVREGYLQDNPIKLTTSPKLDRRLPDVLTDEELVRLLDAPERDSAQGLRDRAILELIYASGMRISELASLDISQLQLKTGEIKVLGKG
jgi:integrase/recombinase XerC